MNNDKLNELIEEYRDACSNNHFYVEAKQAIIDYVEREKKEELLLHNKYNNLIMAVASKYPNESRHDTALRYIKEAENIEATGAKAS
jgi:hypothetical protein